MENLYPSGSDVIELNLFDFDGKRLKYFAKVKKGKPKIGIIVFYAPWCVHCVYMKELLENLASQFKNRFNITAVNCEHPFNYSLRWLFEISCYPTIMYFNKTGEVENYLGTCDKDGLLTFISSKL